MGYADELSELWKAEEKREHLIKEKGGKRKFRRID